MAAELPESGYFSSDERTNAEMKQAFEDQRDFIELAATAEGTSYDNTESGLAADNVQEAVDEAATAQGTSYDNAQSGLNGSTVQQVFDSSANAASRLVTTSATDTTAGRLLKTGDGGWLSTTSTLPTASLNTASTGLRTSPVSGFSRLIIARLSSRAAYLDIDNGGGSTLRLFAEHYNPESGTSFTGRREIYHTGNTIVDSNGFIKVA